ncbi:ABC transporter substrate-binding protein [Sphingobium sp. BYY-5]|uniref:ABC transporter substrate-binding protein n=1 Tax=Sphingobium sp. BYY-5 TaxID=2926400 RepID=UPI001FA70FB5|nr:ABC transporter substrate-binding protein [Sphingobium sp. BYY-5]MCI4589364.1 ABC transporter substrate-binding protein [Sphingobium sp. BYY-5]
MSRKAFLASAALCLVLAGGSALWAAVSRPAAQSDARPRRIVSLNLCADQLVLALADRSQIAGLTRNATDTDMSGEAARARGLPILTNSAEQILAIDPDLVIGMPARRSTALGVLKGQGYKTLDLKSADSLDDIYASIRATAAAVGHSDRGEAMIAGMKRDLAGLGRPGAGRVAAYYQRRGFMTGTGTLVDDLMQRMGLVNLAAKLGKPALAQVSLEEMVAARPDYLIVESATSRVTDQGSEMLHHPALRDIPRISIPQAWTVCGSPAYTLAARAMAQQIVRLNGGHR